MITAKEANARARSDSAKKQFLEGAEKEIERAVALQKFGCKYIIYDELIGSVHALYSKRPENEALTELGKICVKQLRDLGYKVKLSLYYEERQFVDMRLIFEIDWD